MAENTVVNLEDQLNASNSNCCFFKGYLDSCCIENQYADKELIALRKQTVIAKTIHRDDTLQIDINKLKNELVYHTQ